MKFDDRFFSLLIEYRTAHLLWKALPLGPEKVAAKRRRNQLHGKVLEAIELLEREPQQEASKEP
jgi:hypothetical protein